MLDHVRLEDDRKNERRKTKDESVTRTVYQYKRNFPGSKSGVDKEAQPNLDLVSNQYD